MRSYQPPFFDILMNDFDTSKFFISPPDLCNSKVVCGVYTSPFSFLVFTRLPLKKRRTGLSSRVCQLLARSMGLRLIVACAYSYSSVKQVGFVKDGGANNTPDNCSHGPQESSVKW